MTGDASAPFAVPGGRPVVSVLMPFHGACPTLEGSVASVLAQSRGDWELILIDDHAAPAPRALAQDLAGRDPRIRLVGTAGGAATSAQGAAAARNCGLGAARGRFVACLDSDDQWHPDKLARQLAFMAARGAVLSFTAYERVDPAGRVLARVGAGATLGYGDMLGPNPMGCLTVIYDRAHFGAQPMPDLPLQHDYALWLRLMRTPAGGGGGALAHGLDEVLARYRVAPGTLSASKARAVRDIWRVWRREEGLGLGTSLGALGRYAAHSLRHRLGERHGTAGQAL